jgi:hypothetical protein
MRHDQIAPREGTYNRQVYDILMANKGEPVELPPARRLASVVDSLSLTYGLDVKLQRRTRRPSLFTLVGEWFGKDYVSYVKETI